MSLMLILVALAFWVRAELSATYRDQSYNGEVASLLAYSSVVAAGFDMVLFCLFSGGLR